jgi:hypothetical protein
MLLAEKHEHPWVKKLDLSRFNLGTGKIALTKGGVYNKKYKIVIPNISG